MTFQAKWEKAQAKIAHVGYGDTADEAAANALILASSGKTGE